MKKTSRFGFTTSLYAFGLFVSVLILVSCSNQARGPRLDTSSEEALRESHDKMLESLASQPEKQAQLNMAFVMMAMSSMGSQGDITFEQVYGQYDGMTADELISKYEKWSADVEENARLTNAAVQGNDRMREIMRALHEFHNSYNALPARCNQDQNGKPLLSWRVHILPFLGQQDLYDQFHLDEPWDSEYNIGLVEKIPVCFSNALLNLPPGHTVYLGTDGKDSVWQAPSNDAVPPMGMKLEDISDGPSFTAALVFVPAEQAVIWSKPADFDFDALGFSKKLKTRRGVLSAATAAGRVFALGDDIAEHQWHLFIGTADGAGADSASDFNDSQMPVSR